MVSKAGRTLQQSPPLQALWAFRARFAGIASAFQGAGWVPVYPPITHPVYPTLVPPRARTAADVLVPGTVRVSWEHAHMTVSGTL